LRAKGVITCIYDKSHNLVKEFKTIKNAANFVVLSPSSFSKYITKSTVWNHNYYFKVKENIYNTAKISNFNYITNKPDNINYKSYRLCVLNINNEVLYKFSSMRKASKTLNISRDSLLRYAKTGKYRNSKFKFIIRI